MPREDEADDRQEEDDGGEDDDDAADDEAASGLLRDLLRSEGDVWNRVGGGEMGQVHGLIASVNGAGGSVGAAGDCEV